MEPPVSSDVSSRFSISISAEEWGHIFEWMRASLLADESQVMGHFLLECHGSSRTWVATDGAQLTVLNCDGPAPSGLADPDDPVIVVVNSRFFRAHQPQDVTLVVEESDDRRVLTLRGDGFELTLGEHPDEFPDWRSAIDSVAGQEVRVETSHLLDACNIAGVVPIGAEPPGSVHGWLYGTGGRLKLDTPWARHPNTIVTITTDQSVPDTVPVLMAPRRLATLLMAIHDEVVVLTLPDTALGPIGVSAGDYRAVLMPVDRWGAERRRLEELLAEFLNVEEVECDDDGDYPIQGPDGSALWVRLHTDARPISAQVFSVLASDVERSPELFEELNSINADAAHVKVIWASGAVMAEVDIVAESLDMAELANALQVVHETADRYRGVLGAFFGASTA